ncbi:MULTISPECIES: DUF397 domain-containing protein [unclassified Streptomyces]|uniref:DUF397 domain-containing protein n=1 Tax=unclassified Streptomyces TaxID=2593676 RepID=UPI002366AF32|nr:MULTISPECIES: DUF397 domain-containing protein [unclassified Streptomyces]MDF3146781.1 DUF397 domain-containing protein [Streptomyces sp. T21Q-yed]WDF39759.1 DUF397 domain-containing protein [Streptomyces sp. T12]
MDTSKQLKAATWRKSSYSGTSGGECVECAALGSAAWRKSSYSGTSGGDCVEVADLTPHVAVRDSKNPEVDALTLAPEAYVAFIGYVGSGNGARPGISAR